MGIRAKYDVEALMLEIKNKIVNEFNNKLDEITTDKAKDAGNIVISDFKYLGGAAKEASAAIDILGINGKKAASYDPYIIISFTGDGAAPVEGMGRDKVNVMILITMIDPNDYTGEIRMLRYRRALKELFETMSANGTGRVSLNAIETLPYLRGADYRDKTKNRLTWGVGLRLTI